LENVSYGFEQWVKDGIFTLYDTAFQQTCTHRQTRKRFSKLQFAPEVRFQIWALPTSLAVTKGILVSFFSSAYWYA